MLTLMKGDNHHNSVMAAHSCGVLKERFVKRAACIRRMQFKGLGFPNKHFATQNRQMYIRLHCLLRL